MFRLKPVSTSTRVAVAVTTVLALGILVLSLVAYLRVVERLRADVDRSLLREAEAYSATLKQDTGDSADLLGATRTYLLARSQAFSTQHPVLLVRFADGRVLSNTSLHLEDAPGNQAALDATTAARAFLDIQYQGERYRAATVPVLSSPGRAQAVFEAALPTSLTDELGTQVLATLVGAGVLVIVLGALLAVWVARASLRPLSRAAETASLVSQSSLEARIDYDGADDAVGRLVSSINEMLDRLEGAFGEQRRFTADASHELRTPLAVIAGHVEFIRDSPLSEEERHEELELIADEVARMGRLVDDLLALARLDAGSSEAHQPLEVSSLLEEAAARGRGLGDRRIGVETPGELWITGEPDQLMQALLNLVGNAVAHTLPGGSIRLVASATSEVVRLEVDDDGPGVREQDLSRVFDRFYRAQGPRAADSSGSGLGLAITRRLIELHGGRIWAAGRPTGGAAFTIELPRIDTPTTPNATMS